MKYFEKKFPGFTVVYLHNSDECLHCQSLERDDFDSDSSPSDHTQKNKLGTRSDFIETFEPIKNLVLEAQKLFSRPDFHIPLPHESCAAQPLKKSRPLKKISDKNPGAVKRDHPNFKNKVIKQTNATEPIKKKSTLGGTSKLNLREKKTSQLNKKINESNTKLIGCNSIKKVNDCISKGKIKESNQDKSKDGSRIPGKGTLKRKRWVIEKLNQQNVNYEDDLFEDKKFDNLQSFFENETDSPEEYELKTPVFPFSLSPRATTPLPKYRDCYNPTQLKLIRKGAEEYHYRRKKMIKRARMETTEETPAATAQQRKTDVRKRLEEVARILSVRENESDSEEDQYFSDVSGNSCKTTA